MCPMCNERPLIGRNSTCSGRCRQRYARAVRGQRLADVRALLDAQTNAIQDGADPAVIAALARDARRILERVNAK